jgi:hypothetical protein
VKNCVDNGAGMFHCQHIIKQEKMIMNNNTFDKYCKNATNEQELHDIFDMALDEDDVNFYEVADKNGVTYTNCIDVQDELLSYYCRIANIELVAM